MSTTNPFAVNTPAGGANPFGAGTAAPTQSINGAAAASANLDQGVQAVPDPPISLDDPLLTSESLTVAEGDAFAQPTPPPDGKYRVKLKHVGIQKEGSTEILPYEPQPQKDKTGTVIGVYARTLIAVTIIDPDGKYDGLHLGVQFRYIDTKVNREGVSKAMTLLNMLRRPDGTPWLVKTERLSHKVLMERLVQATMSEPELGAESVWEWSCEACNAEAKAKGQFGRSLQGMTKFPANAAVRGQYLPDMRCPVNPAHMFSRARAVVARFMPLSEVRK
jgi:hypothetical protein